MLTQRGTRENTRQQQSPCQYSLACFSSYKPPPSLLPICFAPSSLHDSREDRPAHLQTQINHRADRGPSILSAESHATSARNLDQTQHPPPLSSHHGKCHSTEHVPAHMPSLRPRPRRPSIRRQLRPLLPPPRRAHVSRPPPLPQPPPDRPRHRHRHVQHLHRALADVAPLPRRAAEAQVRPLPPVGAHAQR